MATVTGNQGLRIPQTTDDPDVVTDLTNVVSDIEKRLVMVFNNTADRSTRLASPTEGMLSYLKDTDKYYTFTGSAWVLLVMVPTFTTGTTVPSSGTGSDGDVFFKIGS